MTIRYPACSAAMFAVALTGSILVGNSLTVVDLAVADPAAVSGEIATRNAGETSEIVAAGEAVATIAPDHVTITVSLSQTAATAAEATAKLETTSVQLREAIKPLGTKWQSHLRDERYAPSGQTTGALSATTAVTVRRDIAVECDDPTKVGAGIDLLTKLPGAAVTDISFSVRNATPEQLELLTKASSLAKAKAEKIAAGLGVRLGRMLSAQLTEEPDGAVIRERMAQGESPLTFQDQRLKLYVTVRYEAVQ